MVLSRDCVPVLRFAAKLAGAPPLSGESGRIRICMISRHNSRRRLLWPHIGSRELRRACFGSRGASREATAVASASCDAKPAKSASYQILPTGGARPANFAANRSTTEIAQSYPPLKSSSTICFFADFGESEKFSTTFSFPRFPFWSRKSFHNFQFVFHDLLFGTKSLPQLSKVYSTTFGSYFQKIRLRRYGNTLQITF